MAGRRTAIGKATRGGFRFTRPDDLGADVIKQLLADVPALDPAQVDDLIVGNAMPEAEQGLNMARMIALMSLPVSVPGMTINRYCASGLEAIAIAAGKIQSGQADVIIAGGAESMSLIPIGGWKVVPNYKVAMSHPDWYYNMGLTAEQVAKEYNVSREDQDAFAYQSHQKAVAAIEGGRFKDEIVPVTVEEVVLDEKMKRRKSSFVVDTDEGPRKDTSLEKLAKLKPVFADKGAVTAGNSSPTSDGAAMVIVMSERMMNSLGLKPIARLMSYHVTGVEPRIMGIGPVEAVPKALSKAGLQLADIELVELNEAFASQSLAVIRKLDLNTETLNVNGGAIALGHPLGVSGCKLSVQLINEMRRRKQRYGMVTMCVGGGQGAAGVFEVFQDGEEARPMKKATTEKIEEKIELKTSIQTPAKPEPAKSEIATAKPETPDGKTGAIDEVLEMQFTAAQVQAKSLKEKPENDVLLKLYALYKQATDGDVHGEKPGMFDIVAKAKYEAWSSQKGKGKPAAMKDYIKLVSNLWPPAKK